MRPPKPRRVEQQPTPVAPPSRLARILTLPATPGTAALAGIWSGLGAALLHYRFDAQGEGSGLGLNGFAIAVVFFLLPIWLFVSSRPWHRYPDPGRVFNVEWGYRTVVGMVRGFVWFCCMATTFLTVRLLVYLASLVSW